MRITYADKLCDPRWAAKRAEIIERDGYQCQRCHCDDETLQVHHIRYAGWDRAPWDYDNNDLTTLCCPCHEAVGINTPEKEIFNPWLTYERMKKELPVLSPDDYRRAILTISNELSL